MPTYVGIDISKRTLAVSVPSAIRLTVANDRQGFETMLQAVRRLRKRVHFVYEPCGYERALRLFLHAHRRKQSAVNPWKVRQFANASGTYSKTDPIDADLLASYAKSFPPAPIAKPDPVLELMRQLSRRRSHLVKAIVCERFAVANLWDRIEWDAGISVLRTLYDEVRRIEKRLASLVCTNPMVGHIVNAMTAVRGVGPLSAVQMLCEVPEIGLLNRRQVASLVGLAPFANDSGERVGVRKIQRGRWQPRLTLFRTAFLAIRYKDEQLEPFYRRLRARGKMHRVALAATMRKLAIRLNGVARSARVAAAANPKQEPKPIRLFTAYREPRTC